MRKRMSTEVQAALSGAADGVWGETDNRALQKLLDPLRSPPKINPFGVLGSEARGLICAPKHEVYDRTSNFLNTLNVMGGLVLGAIGGIAISPFKVADLPEEKQALGEIYNVLAYVCVTTQICVVMFSTYMLFLLYAHAHSPEVIYRFLAYGGPLIGACQLAVYMPLLCWLLTLVIAAHINFDVHLRWVCTAAVAAIYTVFHFMFAYCGVRAFPRGMWPWLGLTAPWLWCSSRVKTDVENFSNMYMAAAASGVLAGKDADQDGVVDGIREAASPEHAELLAWIDRALPPEQTEHARARRALLVQALVEEGLTLTRLIEAVKLPGGFKVLLEMLDLSQNDSGVHMTRGERLALATAAMKSDGEHSQALREAGRGAPDGRTKNAGLPNVVSESRA